MFLMSNNFHWKKEDDYNAFLKQITIEDSYKQ